MFVLLYISHWQNVLTKKKALCNKAKGTDLLLFTWHLEKCKKHDQKCMIICFKAAPTLYLNKRRFYVTIALEQPLGLRKEVCLCTCTKCRHWLAKTSLLGRRWWGWEVNAFVACQTIHRGANTITLRWSFVTSLYSLDKSIFSYFYFIS